jgi:oxygen-dependent protoporphyrinogen oxidase
MSQQPTPPRVAVIGGGITGLVAARTMADKGCRVTVLEASDRLGGQVRTVEIAGLPADVGAEALHLAGPHVAALVDELGLEMIRSNPGSAWIRTEAGLRALPAGVGPAGPTRLGPVITSRILSPLGLARAAMEPLVPRGRELEEDVGVGEFLSHRFGRQLTDRLVDPVLGSLHAGEVDRLSLRAATPYVAAQVEGSRSLLLAQRQRSSSGPPAFMSFRGGLGEMVGALTADERLDIRCGTAVTGLLGDAGGVRVSTSTGSGDQGSELFDAAVLAVPAHVAGELLGHEASEAASVLAELRSASVVTMLAAYPRKDVMACSAFEGTGLLFPSSARKVLKAATFLSTKWPQLHDPDIYLVRMSAGRAGLDHIARLGHDELVHRLHTDLALATGLRSQPVEVHIERWPRSIAQLEVGHLERMAAIRSAMSRIPVVLAGAPYEGIGLATCIRSGRQAAESVMGILDPRSALAR